jgi:hypothetical protein
MPGRALPQRAKLFLANSHQNSHSLKIKMATDLAASHLADFIGFFAPQLGLEPTTPKLYPPSVSREWCCSHGTHSVSQSYR